MNQDNNQPAVEKSEWIRPELHRLEAGAAESSHNATADGGGGQQGS